MVHKRENTGEHIKK